MHSQFVGHERVCSRRCMAQIHVSLKAAYRVQSTVPRTNSVDLYQTDKDLGMPQAQMPVRRVRYQYSLQDGPSEVVSNTG